MIPEAAVEAAARAMALRDHNDTDAWSAYKNDARAALETAAPHMHRPVTDEGFGYAVSAIRGHGEFTTAEAEVAVQDIIDALGMTK